MVAAFAVLGAAVGAGWSWWNLGEVRWIVVAVFVPLFVAGQLILRWITTRLERKKHRGAERSG